MIELPLLWVPGCVIFPGEYLDVALRGRGRARAIWNAEEESQGRLLVAPGSFAPRRAEDLPKILCIAELLPEEIEGGRRLLGIGRVRVERVARAGRGRTATVEPLPDGKGASDDDIASARSAWRQLHTVRERRPPRSDDVARFTVDDDRYAWIVASVLPASTEERLGILAEADAGARLRRATRLLQAEVDVAILEHQIIGQPADLPEEE